ncbi:hypothetical protein C8F04DRAFT_1368811 [Mycena alexandri]|uniref:Uncharacterized protein n=1 Tax=Mycena alexandri TaxID=1745969 RepID=A0AAD6WWA6_9AGAR|nr:hypothetical protein C8F04DRAFT_1368811 [Mycena alexandri]
MSDDNVNMPPAPHQQPPPATQHNQLPPPTQHNQPLPPVQHQQQPPPPPAAGAPVVGAGAAQAQAPPVIPIFNVPAPATFVLPDEDTLAAHTPPAAMRNPHLQAHAPQPAPPVDADGRTHFQQLDIRLCPHVRTNTQLEESIADTHLVAWKASPHHQIYLTIANGGNQLFNQVDFEDPLEDKFLGAFRTLAPDGVITVEAPVSAGLEGANINGNKFGGPSTFLVTVESDAGANAICAQHVFRLDPTAGGWVHNRMANAGVRIWTLSHHNIKGRGTKQEIEAAGRVGIIRTAFKSREAYLTVDQQTASRGGPADQRIFDALNTIHCEYVPHKETPVLVTYMEPIGSEQEHERLAQILHKLNFVAKKFGFQSRSPTGLAKECVLCKGSEHPSFNCPSPHVLRITG